MSEGAVVFISIVEKERGRLRQAPQSIEIASCG
jgi:hypothetical protein